MVLTLPATCVDDVTVEVDTVHGESGGAEIFVEIVVRPAGKPIDAGDEDESVADTRVADHPRQARLHVAVVRRDAPEEPGGVHQEQRRDAP